MRLYSIDTGSFRLDGGALFGVVPKSMWHKLLPADENNLCELSMRSLLVEYEKKLVLIDCGIGNKQDPKFFSRYFTTNNTSLTESIVKAGFAPKDITDVFLTHLHFDHCGGAIARKGEKLEPLFPNAMYWSNDSHWDWAVKPNDREKASFLNENIVPMEQSGQLKRIQLENPAQNEQLGVLPFYSLDNILPFGVRIANGHTKDMMLPQLKYKEKTLVFVSDLLPTTAHVGIPYVMSYDMFPLTTLSERASFWKEAADNNYVLLLQHDSVSECCTIQQTEKGYAIKDTFRLDEL